MTDSISVNACARKIRVLIVCDSAQEAKLLAKLIDHQSDMQAVGTATDTWQTRELIRATQPDLLMLEIGVKGIEAMRFLEKLMQSRPMPVLALLARDGADSEKSAKALQLGAVDFIFKPEAGQSLAINGFGKAIGDKVRHGATVKFNPPALPSVPPNLNADSILPLALAAAGTTEKLIIVGASTGGTEAIKDFLLQLPVDCPGILIAQHMPEAFTRAFAERLDSLCKIKVKEAQNGERIRAGHAYVAPGHSHLLLKRTGAGYQAELNQGPPVNRHRPSVDVLFRSAANCAGNNAIGVILTGMGKDGAAGMLEMKRSGAYNFAQDQASCVVFGMPREAILNNAVDEIVPIRDMAARVMARIAAISPA